MLFTVLTFIMLLPVAITLGVALTLGLIFLLVMVAAFFDRRIK